MLTATTEADAAAAICAAMRTLEQHDLNRVTAGNVSVRTPNGFLITPSGVKPAKLTATQMVALHMSGEPHQIGARPSSEWRFHCDLYAKRSDCAAVVHVHSPYATALSCQRRAIPPFHYMIAVAGGDSIRCADYATFGTQALADAALSAMTERRACLLANHGMIAIGATLERAVDLALEVEDLARQYLLACMSGTPVLLSAAAIADAIEQFKSYGAGDGQID